MFSTSLSNSNSLSQQEVVDSGVFFHGDIKVHDFDGLNLNNNPLVIQTPRVRRKRNLPGNPDPNAEVIALSPKTLLTTNRFVCEICKKGFQRDQNLQLHRRGHNLPWKLKQRTKKETTKKAYVCPEETCVHHNPSRALGDLTGIKKHFCRKHGEKKWKCEKCSKIYAVQSDWKAHSKTCGTREYRCDCGTLFPRKDSLITHRAFCDALAQETAKLSTQQPNFLYTPHEDIWNPTHIPFRTNNGSSTASSVLTSPCTFQNRLVANQLQLSNGATPSPHLSATALLQKAATIGATSTSTPMTGFGYHMGEFGSAGLSTWQSSSGHHRLTRDFLGLDGKQCNGVRDRLMAYDGRVGFAACYDNEQYSLKAKPLAQVGFGYAEAPASDTWRDC